MVSIYSEMLQEVREIKSLPNDTQSSLMLVPVGSVGDTICQVYLVSIFYPSLHTVSSEVALFRSIGVEEMVDCLLPAVRGLHVSRSIHGSDEPRAI